MKLKPIIWIVLIIAIISVIGYFFYNQTQKQEKKLEALNTAIAELKTEYTPIRYKITQRDGEKITVAIKFYDLDGKQIGKTHKFNIKGTTPSFDFIVIKFEQGYLAFPYKLFSDQIKPEDGISLFEFYTDSNFPAIYFSHNSSKEFKNGISTLFKKIQSGEYKNMENVYGNMVQLHPAADSTFGHNDIVYKIIVHKKGGIEIIED